MMNQKEFSKWWLDFQSREFMKGLAVEDALYELYKEVCNSTTKEVEDNIRYEVEAELDDEYHRGYREGYDDGYNACEKAHG